MIKVLGIGGSSHDFSYCIVKDGEIVFATEEERISREKHAIGPRSWRMKGLEYSLSQCGYTIQDMDMIITNNIINMVALIDRPWIHNVIQINHHIAHIAASYYTAPFDECALAVLDGCGTIYYKHDQAIGEIFSTGYAKDSRVMLDDHVYGRVGKFDEAANIPCFVCSLGHFYMYVTYACGFHSGQEGKTMGLASYGNERFVERVEKHLNYEQHEFMNKQIMNEINMILHEYGDTFQVRADLAYMAQFILEKYIIKLLKYLHIKNPSSNLCLSGGVTLNSALNGKIIKHTPFQNVYIYPAAGDAGTSVGAALYGYHMIAGNKRSFNHTPNIVYSGKCFTNDEIIKQINRFASNLKYEKLEEHELIKKTASQIANGKICGWFQDRSEMGPRALGNRSILADPRNKSMKDYINKNIKFREDFRPFAPSVLQEAVADFFETDIPENPFMLYVGKVRKDKCNLIPAVTHVDKSARLQTVNAELNPRYYALIREFGKITGVPILLNTSFNIRSQPIVDTPDQAIKAFIDCNLDFIVIGDFLIEKNDSIFKNV